MRQPTVLLLSLLLATVAGCNRADHPGGPAASKTEQAPAPAPMSQTAAPSPHPAMPAPTTEQGPQGAPAAAQRDPHAGMQMPMAPAAAPAAPAKQAPGKLSLPGVETQVPKTWVAEEPASSMRAAQYRVPGATADANGEVAIFHFPPGQGGSQEANISRWTSQFSSPDGKPVQPVIKKFQSNGMDITTVELQGSYARGVGMGPQGQGRPDQILLVGLVETPKGRVTVQLHGPKATVNQNRSGFLSMLQNMHQS